MVAPAVLRSNSGARCRVVLVAGSHAFTATRDPRDPRCLPMADAARLHWPREEAVLGCRRGRTARGRRLRRGQCSGCEEVGDQVSVGAEHPRSPVGRRPRITILPTTNLGRWAVGLAVAFFPFVFAAAVAERGSAGLCLRPGWRSRGADGDHSRPGACRRVRRLLAPSCRRGLRARRVDQRLSVGRHEGLHVDGGCGPATAPGTSFASASARNRRSESASTPISCGCWSSPSRFFVGTSVIAHGGSREEPATKVPASRPAR